MNVIHNRLSYITASLSPRFQFRPRSNAPLKKHIYFRIMTSIPFARRNRNPHSTPITFLIIFSSFAWLPSLRADTANILGEKVSKGWKLPLDTEVKRISADGRYVLAVTRVSGRIDHASVFRVDDGSLVRRFDQDDRLTQIISNGGDVDWCGNGEWFVLPFFKSLQRVCVADPKRDSVVTPPNQLDLFTVNETGDSILLSIIQEKALIGVYHFNNAKFTPLSECNFSRSSTAKFSPDGSRLVVMMDDEKLKSMAAGIWNVETGKLLARLPLPKGHNLPPFDMAAWSRDSSAIVAGAYDRIYVWRLNAARPQVTWRRNMNSGIHWCEISPDGGFVYFAERGGSVNQRGALLVRWDSSKPGAPLLVSAKMEEFSVVAQTVDGKSLLAAGSERVSKNRIQPALRRWVVPDLQPCDPEALGEIDEFLAALPLYRKALTEALPRERLSETFTDLDGGVVFVSSAGETLIRAANVPAELQKLAATVGHEVRYAVRFETRREKAGSAAKYTRKDQPIFPETRDITGEREDWRFLVVDLRNPSRAVQSDWLKGGPPVFPDKIDAYTRIVVGALPVKSASSFFQHLKRPSKE